jgi:hypothetical protein
MNWATRPSNVDIPAPSLVSVSNGNTLRFLRLSFVRLASSAYKRVEKLSFRLRLPVRDGCAYRDLGEDASLHRQWRAFTCN